MHVNLSAEELDFLVHALNVLQVVDRLANAEPDAEAAALLAKLAGTCR